MTRNAAPICRTFARLVPVVAICLGMSCSRKPPASTCETQAVAALYRLAVAQAAYSYLFEQEDGVPRFATSLSDLYHAKSPKGEPIDLIDRAVAEANSPEAAHHYYYFSAIPRDATGPIDPRLDFAICAVPLSDNCTRYVIRGTGGCAYMESAKKTVREAVESYPDLLKGGWIPIGFAGHLCVQKAGAVVGGEWREKWGQLLTKEDFEEWRQARRQGRGPAYILGR